MATIPKGYKAYVSDFLVSVGPLMSKGELVKINKTDDTAKYVSVCPDCTDPTKPRQTYICGTCNSDHPIGELAKAKVQNGVLAFVDKDAVADAKKSDLPKNVLKATVHPADEAWHETFNGGGNAYVFVPMVADEFYATLVRLVDDNSKAFLGICNLRNNEGLFQLRVWRDQLVVQKMAWPDEIDALEPAPLNTEPEVVALAREFMEKITVPFDASSYRSTIKERLAAINAALDGGVPVATASSANEKPMSSLLALLKASVAS